MYGFIYETTNLVNNKKYIGKRKCTNTEKDKLYLGSGKLLRQAFTKYGKENFIRNILCECENEEELNLKEKYYIEKYNAVDSPNYYNLIPGGIGYSVPGVRYITNGTKCKKVLPEELNDYIARGWKLGGPRQSEETKIKRANANRGKKRNASTGKKISKALSGKPLTKEHREKLSLAKKGHITSNAKKIVCIETGEVFASLRQAASKYGVPGSASNICNCLKGKQETAFNLHWKYVE